MRRCRMWAFCSGARRSGSCGRDSPRRTLEDMFWSLRDVSLVKIGSGKTVREFTTRLNDGQKDLPRLLGGAPLSPHP